MTKPLRCGGTIHAVLISTEVLEVKCKRRSCGVTAGTVVFHRFNIHTGELIETLRFKDPRKGN